MGIDERLALLAEVEEIAQMGSWVWHVPTNRVYWSDELFVILGLNKESHVASTESFFAAIHPEDLPALQQESAELAETGIGRPRNVRIVRPTGEIRHIRLTASQVLGEDGTPLRMVGTLLDLTDQREMEAQLRQSQKMDALGKLAGGVAHDLNNYLQVVAGNLEVVQNPAGQSEEDIRQAADDIRASLRLCTALTRGLLAFSRQQSVEARATDMHRVIESSLQLVGKLLGVGIRTTVHLEASRSTVVCDPHQLEQVLFNLAINARDAMGSRGELLVTTSNPLNKSLPETDAAGELLIEVRDNGTGIDPDVLPKIFDPFFTTKSEGHGTGLGLSTVFGIVEQAGGTIRVHSEVGTGTSFHIHLPLSAQAQSETAPPRSAEMRQGSAKTTILVVEDEPMVRRTATRSLRRAGYQVLEAKDGREALELLESDDGQRINAILSDVVMPHAGGPELIAHLKKHHRPLPVLLMTGYAEREILERGPASQAPLLAKPFSPDELLDAIASLLEDAAR